jgi:hypothetical protein
MNVLNLHYFIKTGKVMKKIKILILNLLKNVI